MLRADMVDIQRQFAIGLLLLSLCGLARAECVLNPDLVKHLNLVSKVGDKMEADMELGLAQTDTPACLGNAKLTFQGLTSNDDDRMKHVAQGMLSLINARQVAYSGDFVSASKALRAVAAQYHESAVYLRAIQDLSNLLDSRPTAPEWQFLASELENIATAEDTSGLAAVAVGHLALHDVKSGHAEKGIGDMETYLAKPHSTQIRLSASVIYLEVLLAAGHRADVQLLSHTIEKEVGETLLDPTWRVRFLQVCVSAYSGLDDPTSQAAYNKYTEALNEAKRESQ